MASFNPQVNPSNDPNFLSYSKPISDPQPNTGLGKLLTNVGNTLEAGVKAADTFVKKNIDDLLYKRVDAERDTFTGALQSVKDGGEIPPNILRKNGMGGQITAEEAPEGVEAGLGRAETLNAALKAEKISQTHYTGQLLTIAKDLRQQYPGYREYIDERMSSITGVNPANAYVRSLISDINATESSKANKYDPTQVALKLWSSPDTLKMAGPGGL